jgi:phosphate/phosphite/phosphonate ABC transporter binding protein
MDLSRINRKYFIISVMDIVYRLNIRFFIKTIAVFAALMFSIMTWPCSVFGELKPVRIGVLANRGVETAMKEWSATADYLNATVKGYSFSIAPLDFKAIVEATGRKEIDFVITNPFSFIELESKYKVDRIATLRKSGGTGSYAVFGGVIFCRADRNDIRDIKDLKGKSFAAVDETSLGGWQAARLELKESGIDPSRSFAGIKVLGTHDAVIYAVKDGTIDAGTVRTDVIEQLEKNGEIRLRDFRIINEQHDSDFPFVRSTRLYPEWPIGALKHTGNALAQEVAIALMRMQSHEKAAVAANISGWTLPQDYYQVREMMKELRIGPYRNLGDLPLSAAVVRYWYWPLLGFIITLFLGLVAAYILKLNRSIKNASAKIERQLRFTETLLKTIPMAVFYKDSKGRYLGCNEKFTEIIGVTEEEIAGKTVFDLWPGELSQTYHMRDMELLQKPAHQAYEFKIKDCNGNMLDVIYSKNVFMNEQGKVGGIIGAFLDITERKKAEAKAIAAKEEWERTFDAVPDLIALIDTEYRIMMVNKAMADKLGIAREETAGLFCYKKVHGTEDPPDYCPFKRMLEDGKEHIEEVRLDQFGGIFHISASPLHNGSGHLIGGVHIAHDITELKRMEHELETLNSTLEQRVQKEISLGMEKERMLIHQSRLAAMGEMIGHIAHQWRQPLNLMGLIIQGIADAYKYGDLSGEYLEKSVNKGMDVINLMSQTIDDFRNFFKPDKVKQEFNIKDIIEKSISFVISGFKNNNIDLKADIRDDITIFGYPNEYRHVLLNILSNAKDILLERNVKNPIVKLSAHVENGKSVVLISDNGGGIDKSIIDKIFEPYFTTKDDKGTGIGLYMSKMIIEKNMGGSLSVKNIDGGAEFRIVV